jgi:hypothetical protein
MAMWASWPSSVTTRFNPSAKALVLPPGNPRKTTTPPALARVGDQAGKRGLRHRQAGKDHEHRPLAHRRAGIGGSPGQQFVEVNRAIRTLGEAGGIDRGDGGKALARAGFGFAAVRFALAGHRIDEGLGISGGLGSPVLDRP